jgi:hypothetical protein
MCPFVGVKIISSPATLLLHTTPGSLSKIRHTSNQVKEKTHCRDKRSQIEEPVLDRDFTMLI